MNEIKSMAYFSIFIESDYVLGLSIDKYRVVTHLNSEFLLFKHYRHK